VVQLLNKVADQERLITELRDENARLKVEFSHFAARGRSRFLLRTPKLSCLLRTSNGPISGADIRGLDCDPFDLIKGDLIAGAIVELQALSTRRIAL
jgi:hypothetical protein